MTDTNSSNCKFCSYIYISFSLNIWKFGFLKSLFCMLSWRTESTWVQSPEHQYHLWISDFLKWNVSFLIQCRFRENFTSFIYLDSVFSKRGDFTNNFTDDNGKVIWKMPWNVSFVSRTVLQNTNKFAFLNLTTQKKLDLGSGSYHSQHIVGKSLKARQIIFATSKLIYGHHMGIIITYIFDKVRLQYNFISRGFASASASGFWSIA